jgi:hypothetical protein
LPPDAKGPPLALPWPDFRHAQRRD